MNLGDFIGETLNWVMMAIIMFISFYLGQQLYLSIKKGIKRLKFMRFAKKHAHAVPHPFTYHGKTCMFGTGIEDGELVYYGKLMVECNVTYHGDSRVNVLVAMQIAVENYEREEIRYKNDPETMKLLNIKVTV
jgi:hypothetical protein